MKLIDTHSHLFLPEFDSDRDQVIQNAVNTGIKKIILPNIDASTIDNLLDLYSKYPGICVPVIGLHPTSVKDNYIQELTILEQYFSKHPFIAIGETGIDLYWDKTRIKQQCESFIAQIDMAKSLHIPLIIHCRESFEEIVTILERKKGDGLTGVFHSFTGTPEQAKIILSLGFKIGINGVVTYKNSTLPQVLEKIPITEIVLETDSPYLTPVPFRGKRNESANLQYVAQKIAQIKKMPIDDIVNSTTKNAENLFKLKD
jgi:TatD DNase family protein